MVQDGDARAHKRQMCQSWRSMALIQRLSSLMISFTKGDWANREKITLQEHQEQSIAKMRTLGTDPPENTEQMRCMLG